MKKSKPQPSPFYRYRFRIIFSLAVTLVCVGIFLVYSPQGKKTGNAGNDFNLLIITLDTTRADHIGAYGAPKDRTPHIDSLASRGILFKNAYTSVPITLPSHSSIFTGKYPLVHGVRGNGTFLLNPNETTLAEKMKENGFKTYAVIASYVLMAQFGINRGFDFFDDSLNAQQLIANFDSEITADTVYEKFNSWLTTYSSQTPSPNSRFFAWVHLYDPHTPYNPPKEYRTFGETLDGLYSGEIAYMDAIIGKIVANLASARLLDNTLIILAGDHGEAFGEHQEFGHSIFCYEENLRVPLIFYNPHLFPHPLEIKNTANLIDIMPTVLELFGIEPPKDMQGQSLTPLLDGDTNQTERSFYIESMHGREELGWAPLTGIIRENFKYISLPEPELYDLSTDKAEKQNLFLKKNRLAKELDKDLLAMVKSLSSQTKNSKRSLTDADKKHLQSLGYISAFSDKTDTNLDPKKGIQLSNRYKTIEQTVDQGEIDSAETQLKEMVKNNPQSIMPQYYGLLTKIYRKRNDIESVIRNWKDAVNAFPKNENFKINLAFEYFQLNLMDDSDRLAIEILKENPNSSRAFILRSRIKEMENRFPEALEFAQKAINLEPNNVSLLVSLARLLGRNKKIDDAAAVCDKIMENPSSLKNTEVKSKLGAVLAEIYRDQTAFSLLSDVAQQGKADAEAWNYLGILYFRQQNFRKAEEAYSKSINLDSKIPKTYNNLGTLYLTAFVRVKDPGLKSKAIEAFNKALSLDDKLVSALNGRASAFKFSNRIKEALSDWKKTISIDPTFTDGYFNLAVTLLEMNRKADALTYLQQCNSNLYESLNSRDKLRLDQLISEARR